MLKITNHQRNESSNTVRYHLTPVKITNVIKSRGFPCRSVVKKERKKESEVTQSCQTICNPMDCSLPGSSIHGTFQARMGCHFLLQGIFLTQGRSPGLLHYRQTLLLSEPQKSTCQCLPVQEMCIWSLGWEDPLEKEMAHFSILAWKILWINIYNTGSSNSVLCDNLEGWDGMGNGREIQEWGTSVYLWLIHVNVWQKLTQYCKTIILLLKTF